MILILVISYYKLTYPKEINSQRCQYTFSQVYTLQILDKDLTKNQRTCGEKSTDQ